jgi:hypothetical protein
VALKNIMTNIFAGVKQVEIPLAIQFEVLVVRSATILDGNSIIRLLAEQQSQCGSEPTLSAITGREAVRDTPLSVDEDENRFAWSMRPVFHGKCIAV